MEKVSFNSTDENANTVVITLLLDKPLLVNYGGPTDEGYSYTQKEYKLANDGYVYRETHERSQDCDGRYSYHSIMRCHVSKLADHIARYENDDTEVVEYFPDWEEIEISQRDYSAEAMNY